MTIFYESHFIKFGIISWLQTTSIWCGVIIHLTPTLNVFDILWTQHKISRVN